MWSTPTHGTCSDLMQLERVRDRGSRGAQPLGDDDRVASVGREVHVVRIVDRDRRPGLPGPRIDRRQRCCRRRSSRTASSGPRPARRAAAGRRPRSGRRPERARVDHVDGAAVAVWYVDVGAARPSPPALKFRPGRARTRCGPPLAARVRCRAVVARNERDRESRPCPDAWPAGEQDAPPSAPAARSERATRERPATRGVPGHRVDRDDRGASACRSWRCGRR